MIIEKNSFVEIYYTIKDLSGDLLTASEAGEPVSFPMGAGLLWPGIEEALEGKRIGDEIDLQLTPELAFGLVNPDLKKVIPRAELDEGESLVEIGDSIALDDSDPITWTVYKIEDEHIFIDGNHPLAGETLHFWVKVIGINNRQKQTLKETDTNVDDCGPGCCC